MNVLSLFDGLSCGQIALNRLGIKCTYFASEIDKYAIKVTMANFPDTIQLGSVVDLDGYSLPKIKLMFGGSPCQSFSFAGKRKGMSTKCETEILTLDHYLNLKSDGYEFEGQSYLFWEYMRILNEVKPDYFLLENVEMGEKWEKVLSKAIGVNPIKINSALVSSQNRNRLYWTNIGMEPRGLFGYLESIIEQPKDKGIFLKDILETEVDEKYFLSDKAVNYILDKVRLKKKYTQFDGDKSLPLMASYFKGVTGSHCVDSNGRVDEEKTGTLDASYSKGVEQQGSRPFIRVHNTMPRSSKSGKGGTGALSREDGKTYCLDTGNTNAVEFIAAMRGREAILTPKRTEYGKSIRKDYEAGNIKTERKNIQQLEPRNDGKTNAITSVQKDNLVIQINPSTESGGEQPYQQNRIYDVDGIAPALSTDSRIPLIYQNRIRRLTPTECERLQTVPDIENNVIFALCYESAKSYVSAVTQNPKLLKLALDAEQSELNELVKLVWKDTSVNHQSKKHTVLQNADMQIQRETSLCTNHNLQENNTVVNNAEDTVISNVQKQEGGIVPQNVFISIIEGRITHLGQEALLPKGNQCTVRKNGSSALKMFGNEIMQIVENVEKSLNTKKDNNFTFITSHLLNTKNLEQALIIYYLFAKNVINGYTQNTIQIKNLSINFSLKHGYTNHVSESQRYKMLGNGWTVDVVSHIFSYLPFTSSNP